jgi:trimethylamine:corrinoid methyltransferase-like protein
MMMSSFVQTVIDHDIIAYLLACRAELPMDGEALALEVIHEVVSDPDLRDLKFAAHPHTVSHLQEGRWAPLAFSYDSFTAWRDAGSPTVTDKAAEAVRRILEEHEPEPLPSELAAALRALAAADGAPPGGSFAAGEGGRP